MFVQSIFNDAVSGVDTGDIGHSLRFRSGASAYLNRTFGTPTSNTVWSFSCKIKRGASGSVQAIFTAGSGGLWFNASDQLNLFNNAGGSLVASVAVFRDPTSHYFIDLISNGTTVKAYVNNVEVLSYTGTVTNLNSAIAHNIGRHAAGANQYLDGYPSRIAFVDGTALTPSSFGYLNTEINEWVSKSQSAVKAVVDAGGANSFMLDFDDATSLTTLGYDKSSKGNNWTLNNFSLTAGTSYDWMLDVPGNSFATLNPLKVQGTPTVADGNLSHSRTAVASRAPGTISIGASDLAYFEFVRTDAVGVANNVAFGIVATDSALSTSTYSGSPTSSGATANEWVLTDRGYACNGSTYTNLTATLGTFGQNDVGRVAVNRVTGKVWFGKNTTWSGDPAAGTGEAFSNVTVDVQPLSYVYSGTLHFNTGQRPLAQTAPTGYKALCQRNMPDPAILNPEKHFDIRTRAGDAASPKTLMSDLLFPPDFIWTKDRNTGYQHTLQDVVRGTGANRKLYSSLTEAEGGTNSVYGHISSFDSNGVTATVGSSGFQHLNASGVTYVDWLWKAGGAAVTNNAGSISSQVSANVTAGFSIVTYTGTGANATVGHGLGKAPGLVIVKHRNGTSSWVVMHQSANAGSGHLGYLLLSGTGAFTANSAEWNNTAPTTSVFSVGNSASTNWNVSSTYVAYCFAEIPGFSKIFSYTGTGSADGPNVECGFKPKFVLIKRTTGVSNWSVIDTARDTENVSDNPLLPNSSGQETTSTSTSGAILDVLSNGFKLRGNSSDINNSSSDTYIGIAFADVPAKYSLAR